MRKENIKLFFIVEGVEANEEIFHDYNEAKKFAEELRDNDDIVTAHIGTVADAFQEKANTEDAGWNYDDYAHTFNKLYPIDLFKAYQAH